ncbi:Spherulation-specific family 4-domain-containing protein [Aspergillus unguis]
MTLVSLVLLLAILSSCKASDDYFIVGDLAQYTTAGVPVPSLSGKVIDASSVGEPADNGVLVFLSPDMETSLRSAMDSECATVDSECYQAVMDVLEDTDTMLTSRSLEERQLSWLAAGVGIVAGILYPLFYLEEEQYIPEPLVIPPARLEDSFNMETATAIVVVTEGDPGPTVTAPPEQDKATGPSALITTLATAGNGGSAGDIEIQLQADVAKHLQALLSGSDNGNCDIGDDFFNSNTIHTRDIGLDSVACGAQNILADSIHRDGFPNWLLMNPARLPWTNAEVVAAVHTVIRWALNSATRLNAAIRPSELQGLAVGAFALSWLYFNNGNIAASNIIPGASLQGGPTATECPLQTALQCGAECGVHSWAPQFDCTTTCSTVTSCNAQSTITTTATRTFPAGSGSTGLPSGGKGQQIAVASYINPLADPAAWDRLVAYDSDKMPILVANVVNGPDYAADSDWNDVITRGAASGKTVLGYVRTGYLGVSTQKFTTRLGSGNLAEWTAQIEQDIDMWYTLYGDNIGGIFFDEGWPECGANNEYVDLYKYINNYTKRKHPGAYTVLNPGSPMAACFEDTMDTLLTFELSYDAYKNSYTPNDWTPKDPRKLWHIIYDVPESAVEEVAQLAKDRGASFIEITNDVMANPYDNLPGESYIQTMLDAIEGGSLLNEDPSPWPAKGSAGAVSGLSVLDSDYSSVKLSWNAASNSLGYHVYSGDNIIASVPSSMTTITIGGLKSGASHVLHVAAVGGSGTVGPASNTVTVTMKSLPGGNSIINYKASPGTDQSTFTADILVPYAFIRLYLWDSVGCEFDTNPGWSVNFKVDAYVCAHYMVEGTTLYKYSGTLPEGSTAPPWAWTSMGTITLDITDYTYKWTLPIGTSTIDTSKFVVQAQGYNPLINVFQPDPGAYDCKGSSLCTTPGLLAWCDHAVNYLHRDDEPFYTADGGSLSGNCWGDQTRGCGVFIQGDSSCTISGNDMWDAYQDIRNIGGCTKCGSFHRDDGCLVTINYVYQCDNHPAAIAVLDTMRGGNITNSTMSKGLGLG